MTRLFRWIIVFALILGACVLVLISVRDLPWEITWDLWSVLTAIGTIGATVVAILLALRGWLQEKDATARLVSAWITDEYLPREDGSSYRRAVHLYVANESNEPVFNAMVHVHVGLEETPLGPLAAPSPISVIPPRRELQFDISVPLLAHEFSWTPKAALTFSDPEGRRWFRSLNGELQNVSRRRHRWSRRSDFEDLRQLGDQQNLFNPMLVALIFLSALREETKPAEFSVILAKEAPGWAEVDWNELRAELAGYQPTSMVDYPAPRIARIKLSGDKSLEGKRVEGRGKPLALQNYMFLTLTLDPHSGWKVFGLGGHVAPDKIYFGGSLAYEVDPYRGSGFLADDEDE